MQQLLKNDLRCGMFLIKTRIMSFLNRLLQKELFKLIKQDSTKIAMWSLFIMGRECKRCNGDNLIISEEADIDGKRYLIKSVITIELIN